MTLARLSSAALFAALLSACAHGGSSARVCNGGQATAGAPAHAQAQRFVVLADEASATPTSADACDPAPAPNCDVFSSSPHPWCNTQPYAGGGA